MSTPDDKRRRSPVDRFRTILSADQSKEEASAARRYPKGTASASLNLPKAHGQEANENPAAALPPMPPEPGIYRAEGGRTYLPAFWTAASIISLVFNLIMLIFVIALLRTVGTLNAASLGPGVLGGLFENFERMDQAHIQTTIPVQSTIPLDLVVPVDATTDITLAEEVSIPGAHVKVNTPQFNIDAPADVTLPAGTTMSVTMNMKLPVKTDVPINLAVPVDIAVQDTELHPAIIGLQDTIRPLYCMITPSAQTLSGEPVCR